MAFITVDFMSKSLMRTVTLRVILPTDKLVFPGMPVPEKKPFKTLYLLHGIFGSDIDWVTGTRIMRWAQDKNLAVVMPAGENGFYVDHPKRGDFQYGTFIGEELVQFTRDTFPLSCKREDTYIAGLSMGGYGALRNGLKYSDTFGAIGAFSSALILEKAVSSTTTTPLFMDNRDYFESVFGNLDELLEGDKNPKILVQKLVNEKKPLPAIYMTCGTSDGLLSVNQDLAEFLKEEGAAVTFEQGPGAHEWDFWDRSIEKFLKWLPLDAENGGIGSGNVGL